MHSSDYHSVDYNAIVGKDYGLSLQKKWPWNAVVPWPWFLFFALEVGEKMLGILLELFVVEDHAEAEGHGGD